jgi:hypothetical protein
METVLLASLVRAHEKLDAIARRLDALNGSG